MSFLLSLGISHQTHSRDTLTDMGTEIKTGAFFLFWITMIYDARCLIIAVLLWHQVHLTRWPSSCPKKTRWLSVCVGCRSQPRPRKCCPSLVPRAQLQTVLRVCSLSSTLTDGPLAMPLCFSRVKSTPRMPWKSTSRSWGSGISSCFGVLQLRCNR